MYSPSVRVFLLDKRHNVADLSHRLAARGLRAMLVVRESADHPAYAGCGDDDQVLEIADLSLDWPGLLRFAKQRALDFCIVCGDGFRGIRLDYCPGSCPFDFTSAGPHHLALAGD
jgi:hypothetical protein